MLYNRKITRVTALVVSILICVLICGVSSVCLANDILKPKKGEPIVVDGDDVEYFEKENKIVAKGNVFVTHGDVKLTCDRIVVNTKTREVLCEGNVRIEDPKGIMTGDRIRYDLLRKRGEIISGELEAFPWFGGAEESKRVGMNEYQLMEGHVTTCDLNTPHYRIKAKQIKVFPNDKVIAKNVTFYIDEVPVLWFPYYYHPILQSRAKVQFLPGQDGDWGNFLLSSWRFYIRGETKVDIEVDYRSKKGFAEGANLYYWAEDFGMSGWGAGRFRAYVAHQNKLGTYDPTPWRGEWRDKSLEEGVDGMIRQMFQWQHRVDFEPGTVGIIEFNKLSDSQVLEDYFYNEYEESNPTLSNFINITSAQENFIFSIDLTGRFNTFDTVVQKQPEVKIEVPTQRLWNTPLYYNSSTSTDMFRKKTANTPSTIRVNRFDTFHQLSYVANVGPINVTPYGSFRETIYNCMAESNLPAYRATLAGGVNAFTRVYRIFNIKTDILGLNINNLRHIVAPNVNYTHVSQPTVYASDLFQMDDIDAIEKQNMMTFSLENKLQTKRPVGGQLVSVDLVRFMMSTEYYFRFQKGKFEAIKTGPYRKHGRFRNFNLDLEVFPYDWAFVQAKMNVNPTNLAINTGSVEFSVNPTSNFKMAMGYQYEKMYPNPRNQFIFDAQLIVSPKWKIGIYERFDVQKRIIMEQQLVVTRDLHCWEVEVIYDVRGSRFLKDEFTLWVAFKLKAFPDVQLGMQRSYSKRQPGRQAPGTTLYE